MKFNETRQMKIKKKTLENDHLKTFKKNYNNLYHPGYYYEIIDTSSIKIGSVI